MENYQFRDLSPKRTCTKKYSDYHDYKKYLDEDFNHHCGYTHCIDKWLGGPRTFQIDHFKPHSKFPVLKNEYSNLVYCCSYVNRLKSDDDDSRYLDPCDEDYNQHFGRISDGTIFGKTDSGKFMTQKLSLNLSRYAIIWNLERLEERINLLKEKKKEHPELKDTISELCTSYFDFTQKLFDTQ